MRKAPTNYISASIRVCVDRTENRQIGGLLYSQQISEPMSFNDISSLLLRVDDLLDYQKFPVAFQRKRTFRGQKQPLAEETDTVSEPLDAQIVDSARGAVTTAVIYVISRLNTTWQGEIDWLDGAPRQPFSSALELIRMIDSAIFG